MIGDTAGARAYTKCLHSVWCGSIILHLNVIKLLVRLSFYDGIDSSVFVFSFNEFISILSEILVCSVRFFVFFLKLLLYCIACSHIKKTDKLLGNKGHGAHESMVRLQYSADKKFLMVVMLQEIA